MIFKVSLRKNNLWLFPFDCSFNASKMGKGPLGFHKSSTLKLKVPLSYRLDFFRQGLDRDFFCQKRVPLKKWFDASSIKNFCTPLTEKIAGRLRLLYQKIMQNVIKNGIKKQLTLRSVNEWAVSKKTKAITVNQGKMKFPERVVRLILSRFGKIKLKKS